MTAYIINEAVSDEELEQINAHLLGHSTVRKWPNSSAAMPADISVAVLIIREVSTPLEEARALAVINAGIRMVCVYVGEIEKISELAQKYCSAKVSLAGGGLGEALAGNDQIQEKYDGQSAPRNPQKPHNC